MAHTSGSAGDASLSTLASVFRYNDSVATWLKSPSQGLYYVDHVELHGKYWGKSMTIDEQEWRESQKAMDLAMTTTVTRRVKPVKAVIRSIPLFHSGARDLGYAKTLYGCMIFVINGMNKLLVWGRGRTCKRPLSS